MHFNNGMVKPPLPFAAAPVRRVQWSCMSLLMKNHYHKTNIKAKASIAVRPVALRTLTEHAVGANPVVTVPMIARQRTGPSTSVSALLLLLS